MLRFQSFVVNTTCRRLVSDWRIVADLLRICCTACHGLLVGIQFVADMLWTSLEIYRRRYDSKIELEGKYSFESTDPRESEIRAPPQPLPYLTPIQPNTLFYNKKIITAFLSLDLGNTS